MKKEGLTAFGAVGSALLASACCIGPLIFAGLGLGAFGLAGTFGAYRPYMIGVTALFLGFGFYMTYRKRPVACENGECEMKSASRWNKLSIWTATVFAAVAMSYPQWSTVLAGDASATESENGFMVHLDVQGMTCDGCVAKVEGALKSVEGVKQSSVVLDSNIAHVTLANTGVQTSDLIAAIKKAGHQATVHSSPATMLVTLKVAGMTCDGCAATVRSALLEIPGVEDATVDWEAGSASVKTTVEAPKPESLAVVLSAASGFEARPAEKESPQ